MALERTTVIDPWEPCSESELKRLRAYEGLVVAVIVIAAVLLIGGTIAMTLSWSLGDVARALGA
jgi:hypothetical protein